MTPTPKRSMKPCPFCGSKNLAVTSWDDRGLGYEMVECQNCLGTSGPGDDEEEAKENWNRRVTQTKTRGE